MTGWLIASSRVVDRTISQHACLTGDVTARARTTRRRLPGRLRNFSRWRSFTYTRTVCDPRRRKYYDRSLLCTHPNGHKITLFLEEAELAYRLIRVDIGKEQFHPQFLAISPNNKVPAIVDHMPADGGAPLSVFESGAILLYLAEKAVSC